MATVVTALSGLAWALSSAVVSAQAVNVANATARAPIKVLDTALAIMLKEASSSPTPLRIAAGVLAWDADSAYELEHVEHVDVAVGVKV